MPAPASLSLERKLPLLISIFLISLATGLTVAGYHEVKQASELRGIERMQRLTSSLAQLASTSTEQRYAALRRVAADSTVVGNPGHPVRVEGRRPSGPDADWAHLPDPVADAIRGLANRLTEVEELVAELTGRKPEGAEVKPLKHRRGPDSAGG